MSRSDRTTVTCPACNHQQEYTFWRSINVTLDPELKTKLLDHSLTTFRCEKCQHTANVNQGLLYHDMVRYLMIMVAPNGPGDLAEMAPLIQKMQGKYLLRVVSSMNELIEKIHILDADLDDRAVEMFKSALMSSLGESEKGKAPQLFFARIYAGDDMKERMEFVLASKAGMRSFSSLKDAYDGFVERFCGCLPTVMRESGEWLRVDREYAHKHMGNYRSG